MDHTASVGHNRFVKLMISVTAIVMAFVLLLEWMDLPDRLLGGGSFTLGRPASNAPPHGSLLYPLVFTVSSKLFQQARKTVSF
eukprot:m.159223 g.159223  ORF g.159223 m.159223 type:complete len:83 (-) comp14526_c0_seq1:520-768(-)